jgi:hypothetical protein
LVNTDTAILEGFREVEAAANFKVEEQSSVNFFHHSVASPSAVIAVAGLVGGVFRGHVVPGGAGAEFPEDAIKDGTAIKGRTAAVERRGRGKERLNQAPLFVGEVHAIFE